MVNFSFWASSLPDFTQARGYGCGGSEACIRTYLQLAMMVWLLGLPAIAAYLGSEHPYKRRHPRPVAALVGGAAVGAAFFVLGGLLLGWPWGLSAPFVAVPSAYVMFLEWAKRRWW